MDHRIARAVGRTGVVLVTIALLASAAAVGATVSAPGAAAGAATTDASADIQTDTASNGTASDHLRATTGSASTSPTTGQTGQYAGAVQTSSTDAPNVEWSRSLDRVGFDVRQRSDGGYVVAGKRGGDVWLATFDANGTREWSRTYGGSGEDIAYSLLVTDDGNYLVAGKTESHGPGIAAVWFLKIDAESGDGMWEETYGGSRWDVAYSVIEATDGGYLLTGVTNTTGSGGDDLLAVKVSQSGTQEWIKTYGGNNDDRAGLGALQTDDGYVIPGRTGSFGEGNVWLLSIDSSGDKRWSRTYAGGSSWDIARARDGGYVLAGKGGGGHMGGHLLIKVGNLGSKQWSKTYGENSVSHRVIRAHDHGYVAGGIGFTETDQQRHLPVFKVTEQGAREWNKSYTLQIFGLNRTADGGYVTAAGELTKLGPPTEPPVPRIDYSPTDPAVGEPIRFNASRSSDPDGEVTAYAWDFDADGTRDATGRLIGHTFDTAGDHTIRLTVTDDDGATASTTETITVGGEDSGGEEGVTIALEPSEASVRPDGVTTLDVVVNGTDAGVGGYDLLVNSSDTTRARIASVEDRTGGTVQRSVASGGSGARLAAFGGDTADSGPTTIATVTVEGVAVGDVDVPLTTESISDESGRQYTVGTVTGATLTVSETAGPPPVVGDAPPTDPDDDGVYEDLNGDGAVTPGDATVLFNAAFAGNAAVTDNAAQFDFNGDGDVTPGDATVLFNQAFRS